MYDITCPCCEHDYKIGFIEDDYWEETCPECEEEFKVEVESNPTLNTSKFNYQICLECNEKFDKYWLSRSKFSEKYHRYDNICESCIIDLYNEMMKGKTK